MTAAYNFFSKIADNNSIHASSVDNLISESTNITISQF